MTVSTLAYGDPYEYKQYSLDTVQDYIWWLEDRVYGRNVFGAGYGYLWIWDMAGPPPAFLWEGDIFAFIPGTNMGEYIMGPVEDLDPKKYLPAPTYADGVPQIGGSGA